MKETKKIYIINVIHSNESSLDDVSLFMFCLNTRLKKMIRKNMNGFVQHRIHNKREKNCSYID